MLKQFLEAEKFRSSRWFDWFRWRAGESIAGSSAPSKDHRYKITRLRTLTHRAIGLAPPAWRERLAELLLRRERAPGPAAEHAVQYLLSVEICSGKAPQREAVVAKGADLFYERQYRQTFNSVMGAFAMTATQALLASGGEVQGNAWARRRRTFATMLDEETLGGPPIVVLNAQTVAIPVLAPRPRTQSEAVATARWLAGSERMPGLYRDLAHGEEMACFEPHVCAVVREADGAVAQLFDAVARSGKLAVLALHPFDPDAMGLHITLFGVQILTTRFLLQDYRLESALLEPWLRSAEARNKLLLFCVGGTEEIFTQCSQNLFVKRRGLNTASLKGYAWSPALPLENLFDRQFEIFQATVSAGGLPGASPRNGATGKAAFVEREAGKTLIVIPYHPGNAVHGHAAKLWSNPFGSLVVWDDTASQAAVTISGPCHFVSHKAAKRRFASSVTQVGTLTRRSGSPMPDPEYWFVQEVTEIALRREPLALSLLDPIRSTSCISAGGHAHYSKKPAYFAADTLVHYDMKLQHERETSGRPIDPSGYQRRKWCAEVRGALEARLMHLRALSR
jgi:hypothetical protein